MGKYILRVKRGPNAKPREAPTERQAAFESPNDESAIAQVPVLMARFREMYPNNDYRIKELYELTIRHLEVKDLKKGV